MYDYAMMVVSVIAWPFVRLCHLKDWTEKWAGSLLDLIPMWIKPDHFSYARMLLAVPVNYFIFWNPKPLLATMLYLLACATDFFDGALARRRKKCSVYGARLDPLADKVLNGSILASYLCFMSVKFSGLRLALLVMVGIEVLTALSAAVLIFLKDIESGSIKYGKLKFGFQCLGVLLMMAQFTGLAFAALSIAAGLGGLNAISYPVSGRS
jgi:phosphatidylglycerophosphate synthase